MQTRLLSDWLDTYMTFTNNSEPPKNYRLWIGISVIASCLRRKCVMNWGTIPFYPNMYIVLVGPSGKCRKGTAMGQGYHFLKEMGIKMAAEATTREALIQTLRSSNDSHIEPRTGRIHLHASLTIYSQELTVFLGYNNSNLMSDLTDWYDCRESWTYRTKHQGTDEITGVYVNLIGATTPELLQTTLPRDAIGGGLTSRMIFVYETRKHKTIVAPFQTDKERILRDSLMKDLEKICMLQGEFKATDAFVERWATWYHTYDNSPPPFDDYKFSGYFERRPNHLMKLSCIMSASRSNSMIVDICDFERALSVLENIERNMPNTFIGVGKYVHSEILERVMALVAVKGVVPLNYVISHFRSDISKFDLEKVIETISSMGQIRIVRSGNEVLLEAANLLKIKTERTQDEDNSK